MNEQKSLSRDDQLKLEAYCTFKDLNSLEARDTMALDGMFLVISAAWLFNSNGATLSELSSGILLVGYVLFLIVWFGLALRTRRRMRRRSEFMSCIEECMEFPIRTNLELIIDKEPFAYKYTVHRLTYPMYRFAITAVIVAIIIAEIRKG